MLLRADDLDDVVLWSGPSRHDAAHRARAAARRYGHDIGDQVLVKLADTCRRTAREMDVVARLGGEDFAVLAPETPLENAGALGERLRDALSKIEVETPSGVLRITVSIGVAARSTTDAGDTFPNMLKRSDVALYQAKSSGRNRVVLEG